MPNPTRSRIAQIIVEGPIHNQRERLSVGSCTPTIPKAPEIRLTKESGQVTWMYSSSGLARVHPHSEKSSQPCFKIRCSRVLSGKPSQHSAAVTLEALTHTSDSPLVMYVLTRLASPHMFAPPEVKFSYPGTAIFMWTLGASHKGLVGSQRLFFITTAVHSAILAVGLRTSKHWPQPPPPFLSDPQQRASGPSFAESSSDADPVSHNRSPYQGPPKSAGSAGAYCGAKMKRLTSNGLMTIESQSAPLQSQK